jgi:cation diffusion facilitator family transporter
MSEANSAKKSGTESGGAICVALAANVVVALAKLAGGTLTGSSAMLSEAAHSVTDTINEVFLLTSLRRSRRPADAQHPFGYGKERFFWSLLAAMGILVAGAGFSLLQAYESFAARDSGVGARYYAVNFAILGVAFIAEGVSWIRAMRQVHRESAAASQSVVTHVRTSNDLSLKTVTAEDTAALVGLLFAGSGLALHLLTGQVWWEGVASTLIAVLLVVVAIALGRDTKDLLIGEAVSPELTTDLVEFLSERPEVDDVIDVLSMQLGVDSVLLGARVDLAAGLTSDEIELASNKIDHEIQGRWPQVTHVFIDATKSNEPVERVGVTPPTEGTESDSE